MKDFLSILDKVKDLVWSWPMLILLLGVGLYLSILLKGIQFRYLGYAIKQLFNSKDDDAQGDISHFEALMTSLAGAIGTGSIVGVATAVSIGGFGAIFWMWVTALLGMATKYAESLLAVRYRILDKRSEMVGGPMEYIEHGLGWKWLATTFAFFGAIAALGTGNLVQVNSIADALNSSFQIDPWTSGLVIAIMTGAVLFGGVKSIGRVAGVLVPLMACFYLLAGCLILINQYQMVPAAFALIFKSAFSGQAAVGGFSGAGVLVAIQMGVSRSVFSNEAGLGISSIASAAAKTDTPGRQALISMTGALISTVVICTITGLVLAVSSVLGDTNDQGVLLTGVPMAAKAFSVGITGGGYVVTIGLVLFAYSTVIAWAYYGEKCFEYLLGERSVIIYRVLFTLVIIPGAALDMYVVWSLADISNALIVFPNLIALVALSKEIVKETNLFLEIADKEIVKESRVALKAV